MTARSQDRRTSAIRGKVFTDRLDFIVTAKTRLIVITSRGILAEDPDVTGGRTIPLPLPRLAWLEGSAL